MSGRGRGRGVADRGRARALGGTLAGDARWRRRCSLQRLDPTQLWSDRPAHPSSITHPPLRLLFGTLGPKQYLTFREPHLGSAVGLLLTHESPRLRKLGVDLLIDFIRCQAGGGGGGGGGRAGGCERQGCCCRYCTPGLLAGGYCPKVLLLLLYRRRLTGVCQRRRVRFCLHQPTAANRSCSSLLAAHL